MRGSPHPPLVGRTALLEELDADLRVAAQGRLAVTMLTGAPGMGKTRLISEFVARHKHRAVALVGRSHPFGATDALSIWVDAFEGHLRTLSPYEIESLCGPSLQDLSDVLPAVACSTGTAAPQPSRARVLGGLGRLLVNLCREGPVLVVLDDVHLADGSSWAALSYLAHHLVTSPVYVVLVARPAELAENRTASDVVMALQQESLLRRRQLGPLDHEQVDELAGHVLGGSVNEHVVGVVMQRSRGVPLFALSLLRALRDGGIDLHEPAIGGLPEDLTSYLLRQLSELTFSERELLELIAVLGTRVDFNVLATLAARPENELIGALGRLVVLHLLAEDERDQTLRYEIAHPLIQEAVYKGVGAARRRVMHRSVARALLAADRSSLASGHFVRSAAPGDDEAIDALRHALARAEEKGSHREALALLDALLEILPAGDRRWLTISDVIVWQSGWVIDHRADVGFDTALRAMWRIDALLDGSTAVVRRASTKFHLGSFLVWGEGDVVGGGALIREARHMFETIGDHRSALLAENELGYVRAIGGDLTALGITAQTLLKSPGTSSDRLVQLQALCASAHALLWGGLVNDAAPVIDRALQLAKEDANLYRFSYLLGQRGYERALGGDMSAACDFLRAGREVNASFMDTHLPDFTSFTRWLAGSLAAGVESGREALAWDAGRISRRRVFGTCFAALCGLEMGFDEEPARLARAAREAFGGRHWWFHSALPDWMDAALRSVGGDDHGALLLLERAVAYTAGAGTHLWAEFLLAELAEVASTIGSPAPLERSIAAVGEPPCALPTPGQEGLARFATGALAVARAQPLRAVPHLQSAVAGFALAGWRLWEARARCVLGRALSRSDRARAADELGEAIRIYVECGAQRRLVPTGRALGELGSHGRRVRASADPSTGLTRREREAARHAISGASAREIAARMFIGERTVETHLAHVYAKLGVSGRRELARKYRDDALP